MTPDMIVKAIFLLQKPKLKDFSFERGGHSNELMSPGMDSPNLTSLFLSSFSLGIIWIIPLAFVCDISTEIGNCVFAAFPSLHASVSSCSPPF